jgi:hypothetical protein
MAFGSSQGLSFGDMSATQEAPKRSRVEDKQTCIPVTVRILEDAIARHAGSPDILIHGTEASIVQLVGVVESLVQQSATLEFQLNDASGRMKVRYYGSDSMAMQGIAAGRYVSIVGSLRTSPTAHVSAMSLRPVDNPDQISYHMIEVAHAALRLRSPTKSAPAAGYRVGATDPITPAKQDVGGTTFSPAKTEAPPPVHALAPAALPMQTPPKADLRTSILEVLRQVQDAGSSEGINVPSLVGRLSAEASSEKVKGILSQLVDEGEAYTTIDDDHFCLL